MIPMATIDLFSKSESYLYCVKQLFLFYCYAHNAVIYLDGETFGFFSFGLFEVKLVNILVNT